MAQLRVAPETLIERMFPRKNVTLKSIGFDRHGDLILDLEGEDIPPGAERITAILTNHSSYERIDFKAA